MRRRHARYARGRVGSYLPLLVTIAILLSWHFFRVSIFLSVPAPCLPLEEFWLLADRDSWPLFGSFALVFLLLMTWNVVAWFEARGRVDRTLLVANGLALVSIAYALSGLVDLAQLEHYKRGGGYAAWNRTGDPPFYSDRSGRTCEAARSYLGTWDVVSVEVPLLGQSFPYRWIEFRRDLTFSASLGRFVDPIEGRWAPSVRVASWQHGSDPEASSWSEAGWIETEEWDGVWSFQLDEEGSRLTLTTPDEMMLPKSRVVLMRR